jgi:hypothetical protein
MAPTLNTTFRVHADFVKPQTSDGRLRADYYRSGMRCYRKSMEVNVANYQGKLFEYIGAVVHRGEAPSSETRSAQVDALRLYGALANNPLSAQQLAKRTGTDRVAVLEWLGRQVSRRHVQYDAARQRYWISASQASAMGCEPGLCSVPIAFLASSIHSGPLAR